MSSQILKELDKIKKNPSFVGIYIQGMGMLNQSGIFDFLKQCGQPQIFDNGKDVQVMAAQAARSAGFNECLNMLLNFREMFLSDITPLTKPLYGANEAALSRGDLTQEELDAIESGRTPEYKSINGASAKSKASAGSGLANLPSQS